MGADNIVVAIRCRPFNKRENDMGTQCILKMQGNTCSMQQEDGLYKDFSYDHCYWSHNPADSNYASQATVHADIGKGVLTNAWKGYNSTLFAYGQTGSGKSYSMIGVDNGKTDPGVVPLVCKEMFHTIRNNPPPDTKFVVTVSMLEIYNEKLRDLLDPSGGPPGGLKLKQNKAVGFYVDGLTKNSVESEDKVMSLMNLGTQARTIRATDMNATSSRAHTVFMVTLEQATTVKTGGKTGVAKKTSVINLVDLAGSERAAKTNATGDALKEGSNINLSLMYLGQVISMLAANGNSNVIPYRQSKLTSILKESLGGNSKTAMIAAVSPAEDNREETLGTLQFASRAKSIKTQARVNLDENGRMLAELKGENDKLRLELEAMKAGGGGGVGMGGAKMKTAFEANKKEIQEMFIALDNDGSGEVTCEEFSDFLASADSRKLGEFGQIISILSMMDNPFESLDVNGDGTITWAEFEEWIDKESKKEVDPMEEVDRLKRLLDDRQKLISNFELSDEEIAKQTADREQKARAQVEAEMSKQISLLKTEVLALRREYGVRGNVLSAFEKNRDKIERLFASLDNDGSGQVSHDEFSEFLARADDLGDFGETMQRLRTAENPFDAIDFDGDGNITWEEFLVWVQQQGEPASKSGKSNVDLQKSLVAKDKEMKMLEAEAEKWRGSAEMLESRVQGLVKLITDMEDKMQRLDRAHRKEVSIWEQQAQLAMKMRGKA